MTTGGIISIALLLPLRSNATPHFLILISFWKWVLYFQNELLFFFFLLSELVNEEPFFLIVNKKKKTLFLIILYFSILIEECNKTTKDSIKKPFLILDLMAYSK